MTGPSGALHVPTGYRVGDWVVHELLATGAFGSVYAARRASPEGRRRPGPGPGRELPQTAALKFLPTGTRTPRQLRHLVELAEREVDVLRRLRRPRLIRMYETLTVDDPGRPELDGATVLVLEQAESSLAPLLARPEPSPAGPALLAQVCEGLHQLHHAGWVHGDLKPANILLMKDGSVRLADFNTAAELDGTHAYAPAFSTPDHTPPELLWSDIGERGRQIRQTADTWAFGVLAHLVLTHTFPLPGGTPSARRDAGVRYARGDEELRLSPQLSEEWRQIIADCLARTHEERAAYGSAALLRRVESATGSAPSPKLPRLRPRRIRTRTVVACAVAAALLATGGALTLREGPPDPAEYGSAELRTDRGVPVEYRKLIVDAAHRCGEKEVTPAFVAALLKVESGFDAELADPGMDEYGIARWTPEVLYHWVDAKKRPERVRDMKPPFPPAVSIPAVGRYTCEIARQLWKPDVLPGDRGALVAAAYRTSVETVHEAGGVPQKHRAYGERVAKYVKEYSPEGS